VHGRATSVGKRLGPTVSAPARAYFAGVRFSRRRSLVARVVVVAAFAAAGPVFVKPIDTQLPAADARLAWTTAGPSCHAPAAGADDSSALIGHLAGTGQLGSATGMKVAVCADGEWALVTMSGPQAGGQTQKLYARTPDRGWTDAGDCPPLPVALVRAWNLDCA